MEMTSFGTVNYNTTDTPPGYVCHSCGAHGVKLYREYQTFLEHQVLHCQTCAAKAQNVDISTMNPQGLYECSITHRLTDSIGWLVLAVPTEEGDAFWGYTSVPPAGVTWWQQLPNK